MQQLCMEKDDEARWLIALVSDTGLRLAEAVGLLAADIKLETVDCPHRVVRCKC
jgi:integrase